MENRSDHEVCPISNETDNIAHVDFVGQHQQQQQHQSSLDSLDGDFVATPLTMKRFSRVSFKKELEAAATALDNSAPVDFLGGESSAVDVFDNNSNKDASPVTVPTTPPTPDFLAMQTFPGPKAFNSNISVSANEKPTNNHSSNKASRYSRSSTDRHALNRSYSTKSNSSVASSTRSTNNNNNKRDTVQSFHTTKISGLEEIDSDGDIENVKDKRQEIEKEPLVEDFIGQQLGSQQQHHYQQHQQQQQQQVPSVGCLHSDSTAKPSALLLSTNPFLEDLVAKKQQQHHRYHHQQFQQFQQYQFPAPSTHSSSSVHYQQQQQDPPKTPPSNNSKNNSQSLSRMKFLPKGNSNKASSNPFFNDTNDTSPTQDHYHYQPLQQPFIDDPSLTMSPKTALEAMREMCYGGLAPESNTANNKNNKAESLSIMERILESRRNTFGTQAILEEHRRRSSSKSEKSIKMFTNGRNLGDYDDHLGSGEESEDNLEARDRRGVLLSGRKVRGGKKVNGSGSVLTVRNALIEQQDEGEDEFGIPYPPSDGAKRSVSVKYRKDYIGNNNNSNNHRDDQFVSSTSGSSLQKSGSTTFGLSAAVVSGIINNKLLGATKHNPNNKGRSSKMPSEVALPPPVARDRNRMNSSLGNGFAGSSSFMALSPSLVRASLMEAPPVSRRNSYKSQGPTSSTTVAESSTPVVPVLMVTPSSGRNQQHHHRYQGSMSISPSDSTLASLNTSEEGDHSASSLSLLQVPLATSPTMATNGNGFVYPTVTKNEQNNNKVDSSTSDDTLNSWYKYQKERNNSAYSSSTSPPSSASSSSSLSSSVGASAMAAAARARKREALFGGATGGANSSLLPPTVITHRSISGRGSDIDDSRMASSASSDTIVGEEYAAYEKVMMMSGVSINKNNQSRTNSAHHHKRQDSTTSESEMLMNLPEPTRFEGMCTCRGIVNIGSFLFIIGGLVLMILGYPIAKFSGGGKDADEMEAFNSTTMNNNTVAMTSTLANMDDTATAAIKSANSNGNDGDDDRLKDLVLNKDRELSTPADVWGAARVSSYEDNRVVPSADMSTVLLPKEKVGLRAKSRKIYSESWLTKTNNNNAIDDVDTETKIASASTSKSHDIVNSFLRSLVMPSVAVAPAFGSVEQGSPLVVVKSASSVVGVGDGTVVRNTCQAAVRRPA